MIGSWYETTVKRTVVKTTPERNRHSTGKSIAPDMRNAPELLQYR